MKDDGSLVDRLAAIPELSGIPRSELEYLVGLGELEVHEAGAVVFPGGERVQKFYLILSGIMAVRVDHGAGPKRIMGWQRGELSGQLPFSRMKVPPGDNYIEARCEVLVIDRKHHPDIIRECPVFTGYAVHSMIDRARSFNSSALQDEKMVSLGRLSAGLAHELNNPASATVRAAKQLDAELDRVENAPGALAAAGLSADDFAAVERLHTACVASQEAPPSTSLEMEQRELAIEDWLERNGLSRSFADSLAESAVELDALDKLTTEMSGEALSAAVEWISARCAMRSLVLDIEQSATRIHDLVAAVKRFTYMDRAATWEPVDLEVGLRDTIRMMAAKVRSKNASVTLDVAENVPHVSASGSELNQVWLNLIDNALDAIGPSGHVDVTARLENGRVVVRVVDDGPGVPPEFIDRLFDPFFTTKPPGQGTGLGLDITQRMLRRYRADIDVKSEPGHTEFRISFLPSSDPATSTAP